MSRVIYFLRESLFPPLLQRDWIEEGKIMYAIIQTGGKQYKVVEGQTVIVERLPDEVNAKVSFEPLMIGDDETSVFGTPTVKGASVTATVVEHGKGEKLNIAVYKKMVGHHRAQGHRQPYTKLKIEKIVK